MVEHYTYQPTRKENIRRTKAINTCHVDDDYQSNVRIYRMFTLNESEANDNREIKDQEDSDEDLVETEGVEVKDCLELEELELIIPLDNIEEQHQESSEEKENSNMYINIYNEESP